MTEMDLKVKEDTYNPLLKRKELCLEVEHEEAGSPSRTSLREAVASKYSTKSENVFVLGIETKTGSQTSTCKIQVYDDPAAAKNFVPKYIQVRNLPSEERKKLKESKKAEEKPKADKPKVEKPKEEKPKEAATVKEEKPEAKPADVQKSKSKEAPAVKEEKPETKPADVQKSKDRRPREGGIS